MKALRRFIDPAVIPLPTGYSKLHRDLSRGVVELKIPPVAFWVLGVWTLAGLFLPAPGNIGWLVFFGGVFAVGYLVSREDSVQMRWRRYATYIRETCPARDGSVRIERYETRTGGPAASAVDYYAYVDVVCSAEQVDAMLTRIEKLLVIASDPPMSSIMHELSSDPFTMGSQVSGTIPCQVWSEPTDAPVAVAVEFDGKRLWCKQATPGW